MSALPKFRFVIVEWEDASGGNGWQDIEQVVSENESGYFVTSAGWLVAENRSRITLAPCVTQLSDAMPKHSVSNEMTIPRGMIRRMRTVKL